MTNQDITDSIVALLREDGCDATVEGDNYISAQYGTGPHVSLLIAGDKLSVPRRTVDGMLLYQHIPLADPDLIQRTIDTLLSLS